MQMENTLTWYTFLLEIGIVCKHRELLQHPVDVREVIEIFFFPVE